MDVRMRGRGWFANGVVFYFHEVLDLADAILQAKDRLLDGAVFFLFIHAEVFIKTRNPAPLFRACLLFVIIIFHGYFLSGLFGCFHYSGSGR